MLYKFMSIVHRSHHSHVRTKAVFMCSQLLAANPPTRPTSRSRRQTGRTSTSKTGLRVNNVRHAFLQ